MQLLQLKSCLIHQIMQIMALTNVTMASVLTSTLQVLLRLRASESDKILSKVKSLSINWHVPQKHHYDSHDYHYQSLITQHK